jgi:ribosomal protein L11 methyltransferase
LLPENGIALQQIRGDAFGDGTHPTTRLCAGAVDLYCRQKKPKSVLDVGTGTGVLARIARARDVNFIAATDIDPQALAAAQANADLDHHPTEILITRDMPDHWGARFELVVANILEGPLRELAPNLSRALTPGGVLLLSGFTPLQIPSLKVPFTEQGLSYISESMLDGWALLMFRR